MNTTKLTQKDYADPAKPFRCPFCLSENVTLEADVSFLGDVLEQPTSCDDCHETWSSVFTLSGFSKP
jgi:C4-type Zn-finger protein